MVSKFKYGLLLLAAAVILPACVAAQGKGVKPLADNASLAETQSWLVENIRKYGSYKSRVTSVAISNVKFDSCALTIALVRKSGSTAHDTMGATARINSVKQEISFDLSFVETDGIQLTDHIYPEFQTIVVRFRAGGPSAPADQIRDTELVVKSEAGEQIRSALIHAQKLCSEK